MEDAIDTGTCPDTNRRYLASASTGSLRPKLAQLAASVATAAILSIALGACGGNSEPESAPSDTDTVASAPVAHAATVAAASSNAVSPTSTSSNDDVVTHEPRARSAHVDDDKIPMWSDVQGAQNPQD